MYTCTSSHTHTLTHARMHSHPHNTPQVPPLPPSSLARMKMHTHARTHTRTHVRMQVCTHTHTYFTHACTHTRTHVRMQDCTHTHTLHTRTHAPHTPTSPSPLPRSLALHGDERVVGRVDGLTEDVCLSVQPHNHVLVAGQLVARLGDLIQVVLQGNQYRADALSARKGKGGEVREREIGHNPQFVQDIIMVHYICTCTRRYMYMYRNTRSSDCALL